MNLIQKLLRPALNFLVETFFPKGMFYGNGYLKTFDDYISDKTLPIASAQLLIISAFEANATSLSVEVNGLDLNGDDIGDWRLTLEQTKRGDDFPRKLNIPEEEKVFSVIKTFKGTQKERL